MPHTPETSSASASAPADRPSLQDQLLDIQNEAKKNKVQLTPEIQAYIRENLEAVQNKLANREDVTEDDLRFIKKVRSWVKLLSHLETRFAKTPGHYIRPKGIDFAEVKKALWANPDLVHSLARMEETGGEPDIIAVEEDAFVFGDCSAESPDRRNLTYDQAAEMAKEFGVDMMSEVEYRAMQTTGKFDQQSYSWLATPADVRKAGVALSGLRDEGDVSVYVRDAEVHYPDRGWRASLRVKKV